MKYPKIHTLFKRNEKKKVIEWHYSKEEFANIKFWQITEKIDGMNIRIEYEKKTEELYNGGICQQEYLTFKGRTNNAQIPKDLQKYLEKTFKKEDFRHTFPNAKRIILFGEGYGKKIQSDKYKLKDKVKFILFDVWIDGWWLEYKNVKNVAEEFKIDVVPLIATWTDYNTIQHIKSNPRSRLNDRVVIEGYVARSYPMVLFRDGTPIKWKIKVKDYA